VPHKVLKAITRKRRPLKRTTFVRREQMRKMKVNIAKKRR